MLLELLHSSCSSCPSWNGLDWSDVSPLRTRCCPSCTNHPRTLHPFPSVLSALHHFLHVWWCSLFFFPAGIQVILFNSLMDSRQQILPTRLPSFHDSSRNTGRRYCLNWSLGSSQPSFVLCSQQNYPWFVPNLRHPRNSLRLPFVRALVPGFVFILHIN